MRATSCALFVAADERARLPAQRGDDPGTAAIDKLMRSCTSRALLEPLTLSDFPSLIKEPKAKLPINA
jgi:hypothetical protein